ncbi:hypothetical protein D3C81_2177560 [compost metagenome]
MLLPSSHCHFSPVGVTAAAAPAAAAVPAAAFFLVEDFFLVVVVFLAGSCAITAVAVVRLNAPMQAASTRCFIL